MENGKFKNPFASCESDKTAACGRISIKCALHICSVILNSSFSILNWFLLYHFSRPFASIHFLLSCHSLRRML